MWLELVPGRLCADAKKGRCAPTGLLAAWVRMLAASACGVAVAGVIVGRDACVTVRPWPQSAARAALGELMQAWHEGLHGSAAPLPLAPRTAWPWCTTPADVAAVYEGSDFDRAARRRRGGLPGASVPGLRRARRRRPFRDPGAAPVRTAGGWVATTCS